MTEFEDHDQVSACVGALVFSFNFQSGRQHVILTVHAHLDCVHCALCWRSGGAQSVGGAQSASIGLC